MIIPSNQIRKSQAQYTKDGVELLNWIRIFLNSFPNPKNSSLYTKIFTNLDKSIINH